ncbi:uncharacterized protein BDZ99DRAFT_463731 [Mytilinidion resinicola]|uniref:Uncharacterized protein n=1 Tax=Mytilinidion resinicola TaxID=574789 RepID=A0A6A6YJZ7_9PEZI|nr:uncharacterized protein BDZ99DRAFT_463731 [Mytilinidion resinicola]KAF2808879.1 hypothetical protein BDZ99DRAFT_463731 [Mytilinidion resinicola]
MPVQRTCCGHPFVLRMPPRRFQLLFGVITFIIFSLVLFGPPSAADIPTVEELKETIKNPKLPKVPSVHNPFGQGAHKSPIQPNSTSGDATWFSDWTWKNPFSSSITLDENRAVLPPLTNRPPIYTYYESGKKQDEEVSKAEHALLLAWRRAWWAQGFKPQVLSRAEAQKNPLYESLQRLRLDSKLEMEVVRWLAWGHMGTGVLANWLALPMASHDNPMLAYLRRGEYPILSRVDTLQNGIFFGEKAAINGAIKKVLEDSIWTNVTANKDKIEGLAKDGGVMINLLDKETLDEDRKADGIAFYDTNTIVSKYKSVAEKITNTTNPEGLKSLATLINSHLHLTWQESFPSGVAILKPLPEHTTALTEEAVDIARNLTQCPDSPIVASCPPNRPKCKACVSSSRMRMKLLPHFRNDTTLYTIGSVPHPYTLTSLHYTRDKIDKTFIRRKAERDMWIFAATQEILGSTSSGQRRVVRFKEAVASPRTASHSLWLTAERESQVDLDWIFGFNLPQSSWNGQSEPPVPGPERRPPPPEEIEGVKKPQENELRMEKNRLRKAREAIKSKDRRMQEAVGVVEAWNLADTEAWRFARAWSARRRVERRKWEEEEQGFAGAEKKAGVGGGRWED